MAGSFRIRVEGTIPQYPDLSFDLPYNECGSMNEHMLGEGLWKPVGSFSTSVFEACKAIRDHQRELQSNYGSWYFDISTASGKNGGTYHLQCKIDYNYSQDKITFMLDSLNGWDTITWDFTQTITEDAKKIWSAFNYGPDNGSGTYDEDIMCSVGLHQGVIDGTAAILRDNWGSPPEAILRISLQHQGNVFNMGGYAGHVRYREPDETLEEWNDYVQSYADSCGRVGTSRGHNLTSNPPIISTFTNVVPETPDDPYPPDDPPVPPTPDPDPVPDPIPIPDLPTRGAGGLVTLYSPSLTQLENIADELYDDNALMIIRNYFENPMDLMVGLSLMPFAVPTSGTAAPKIGLFTFNHSMPLVANQFIEIDCGSLDVKAFYGTAFDYSPYTKIEMWLPFIGYQQIDVDEVMGNSITVKYHIDVLSGSCVAFVQANIGPAVGPAVPIVIAQYSGNCSVQIPFSGQSYDQVISDAINMLTGIASAGGGVSTAVSAASLPGELALAIGSDMYEQGKEQALSGMTDTVGTVADTMGHKPTIVRNGVVGASCGYMGIMYPYIIKKVPWQSKPDDYANFKGYPCNKMLTLSQLTGYAQVDDIHLNNIPATEPEVAEIYKLLKGGILL